MIDIDLSRKDGLEMACPGLPTRCPPNSCDLVMRSLSAA